MEERPDVVKGKKNEFWKSIVMNAQMMRVWCCPLGMQHTHLTIWKQHFHKKTCSIIH